MLIFKSFLVLAVVLFLSLSFRNTSLAIVDPIAVPNNKYGIHVIDENDLEDAAKLVNSKGGDWGYITIVISENDRDSQKWQRIFDKMRELKLIPIVRLATKPNGAVWVTPQLEEAVRWLDFLSTLNWVTKNRYIILFNEPNHANEWGGKINPEEYARIAKHYRHILKQNSQDYFILPAGFDVTAPSSLQTSEVTRFYGRMVEAVPEIFTLFDGWTSHSYPNPHFLALPTAFGKTSIRSYDWEISFLKPYGLRKNIPIFITETGWVHKEGKKDKVLGYNSQTVANFFATAFTKVWTDPRIVAITPFVLNYQDTPFDYFSWKKFNSGEFYPQYYSVQALEKPKGEPEQYHDSQLGYVQLPKELVSGSEYKFTFSFRNTGQSIWDFRDNFSIKSNNCNLIVEEDSSTVKPYETGFIQVVLKTPSVSQILDCSFFVSYKGQIFGSGVHTTFDVIKEPEIQITATSLLRPFTGQAKLVVYSSRSAVWESNLSFKNGESKIRLKNIIPEERYRFVLLPEGYLAKEINKTPSNNLELYFGFLIGDQDKNGKLSLGDFVPW